MPDELQLIRDTSDCEKKVTPLPSVQGTYLQELDESEQ
jgi:hypothetical protein